MLDRNAVPAVQRSQVAPGPCPALSLALQLADHFEQLHFPIFNLAAGLLGSSSSDFVLLEVWRVKLAADYKSACQNF